MDTNRLEEIESRLNSVTPFPWKSDFWNSDSHPNEDLPFEEEEILIESKVADRPQSVVVGKFMYDGGYLLGCTRENATFLTLAPEDVRFLLDTVYALQDKIREYETSK